MTRQLHSATSTALDQSVVTEGWFIRLDIAGDPVQIWTGVRNIKFEGVTATGDAALDGITFEGMGEINGIGNVVDGPGGSQALQLKLPGINLDDDALRQVVGNKANWQRRQAWLWIATLDADYNIVGRPFRIKTGRMDKMNVGQDRDDNFVSVTIESYQAYAGQTLNTKYIEQNLVDNTDTSQGYVHALANMQPVVGGAEAGNPQMTLQTIQQNLINGTRQAAQQIFGRYT